MLHTHIIRPLINIVRQLWWLCKHIRQCFIFHLKLFFYTLFSHMRAFYRPARVHFTSASAGQREPGFGRRASGVGVVQTTLLLWSYILCVFPLLCVRSALFARLLAHFVLFLHFFAVHFSAEFSTLCSPRVAAPSKIGCFINCRSLPYAVRRNRRSVLISPIFSTPRSANCSFSCAYTCSTFWLVSTDPGIWEHTRTVWCGQKRQIAPDRYDVLDHILYYTKPILQMLYKDYVPAHVDQIYLGTHIF